MRQKKRIQMMNWKGKMTQNNYLYDATSIVVINEPNGRFL